MIVQEDFEAIGAYVVTLHGHAYQKAGIPDIQVYHPHWSGHIEFKYNEGTIKTIQSRSMEAIRRGKVPAIVMRYSCPGKHKAKHLEHPWVDLEDPRGKHLMSVEGWWDLMGPIERARYVVTCLQVVAPMVS